MKLLITGCKGRLGAEIQKQLKLGYSEIGTISEELCNADVTAIDIDTLDLSDENAVMAYISNIKTRNH